MRFWVHGGSTVVKRRHPVRSWLWEILKFSLISLQVFSMSFSYFFPGLFLVFGLWLGVARSPFLDEFKHWTIFIFEFSFWNNFPRIDAVLGLLGVDSGEASPSSKKLIIGNPEIWLDFRLSFLDVFLKDFAGTFLVFGLWLGVARSPFLEQFYLYRFLYRNSKMVFLK